MNEAARIQALLEYHILDTGPEKDFDELVEIASAVTGAPMSLITFIDDRRQWFKSVKGIRDKETLRVDSFCQYALDDAHHVLVVNDPLTDERFKNNRYVIGDPYIRFYAGAPLGTDDGHVLGTLCVLDDKPRIITDEQKKILQLLAKKAMDFLRARRLLHKQGLQIESNAHHLKKLTDMAPGCIYQFEKTPDGHTTIHFVSEGIKEIHPKLTPEKVKLKGISIIVDVVEPDDRKILQNAMDKSYGDLSELSVEFRVSNENHETRWYWAKARAERETDGHVMWYGMFQDITDKKSYEATLEQISFDISHVMRRPVATMLGLTEVIQREKLDREQILQYVEHIKTVSKEMDSFTRKLNLAYSEKMNHVKHDS